MPAEHSKTIAGILPLVLWAVVVSILSYSPVVPRFEVPWLNYAAFILFVLALPLALLWLAFHIHKGPKRWIVISLVIIVLLPAALPVLFATIDLTDTFKTGVDLSFERINEVKSDNSYYRLYRTNGGATTSYGLVLRKEQSLLPGLKVVKVLKNFYPAYDGRFEPTTPDKMRLIILPYKPEDQEQSYDFKL